MLSKEIPESDWRILQNALRVDSYSLFFHSRNQLFSLYCPKSVVPDYLFKLYQVAETLRFETEALQQLALIGFHACPKIKIVTSHGIALQYISYGSLARSLDIDFISAESPLTNTLTAISVTEQIFEQLNILKSTATVNNDGDNYFLKRGLKAANIVNQNRERHPFTLLADKVSQYLVEFGKYDAYQAQICRVHGDLRIHNILISTDVKEIVFVDWELSHYGDCNVDYAIFFLSLLCQKGRLPNRIYSSIFSLVMNLPGFQWQKFQYFLLERSAIWLQYRELQAVAPQIVEKTVMAESAKSFIDAIRMHW